MWIMPFWNKTGRFPYFKKKDEPLSHALVIDGILNQTLLKKIGKNKHWLDRIMKEKNIRDLHNIFLLSVTDSGSVTLIRQNETES